MDTFDHKPALEKHDGEALGPKEKPEGFTTPEEMREELHQQLEEIAPEALVLLLLIASILLKLKDASKRRILLGLFQRIATLLYFIYQKLCIPQ